MDNRLLGGVVSLLVPFGAYALPSTLASSAYSNTQRSYLQATTSTINGFSSEPTAQKITTLATKTLAKKRDSVDDVFIASANATRELIIIDKSVPDKHLFYKKIQPGVEVKEIDTNADGLSQLTAIVSQYQGLEALHIVSHASDGVVYLGNSTITEQLLQKEMNTLSTLNNALNNGADLLFYGCDLAKTQKGEDLLSLISHAANIDVAASNNLTGNSDLGGDWELEITKGDIETTPLGNSIALKTFSGILLDKTINMDGFASGTFASSTYTTSDGDIRLSTDSNKITDLYRGSGTGTTVYINSGDVKAEKVYVDFTNGATFNASSIRLYNCSSGQMITVASNTGGSHSIYLAASGFNSLPLTTNFTGINKLTITSDAGAIGCLSIDDIVLTNITSTDSDGTLTASTTVDEPIDLDSTDDTAGEAKDLFDFKLSDGGGGDGLALDVTQVKVHVSGTSTDALRDDVTWRLNGTNVTNKTGTYDSSTDTITFSGLSISVADGGTETYTVNGYFNTTNAIVDNATFGLSIDGDTDLTLGSSGTKMASTTAISNGSGGVFEVTATQLKLATQPAGSVSGSALTTQPIINAQDAFGNVDKDFTETITLTEASAGALTNNTKAAVAGVATFSGLTYTATADQQNFTLTANDDDSVNGNLATVNASAITSDVVATKLIYSTQPAPLTVVTNTTTSMTTIPVVSAVDANGTIDSGYTASITLSEVNGTGSATMTTTTGDTDSSSATVTLSPTGGVTTFTGMQVNYDASGTFNLQAASGGLTTVDSSQFTSSYPIPTITSATYDAHTEKLVVKGTNFLANSGGADVDVSKLTITGQVGLTHTLSSSADVEIDSATQFSITLAGTDSITVNSLLNLSGTKSVDNVTYNLAAADDFITFITDGDTSDTTNSITVSGADDGDGSVTAGSLTEATSLSSTIDTVGEALDVYDFSINDSGTADGLALTASAIVVNVSGTSSDALRNDITWRLNGLDASNVVGVYNANKITFSGLTISVANGTSETYTVSAYYNDNTSVTDGATFILSTNGDTDFTVGSGGTQMGVTTSVTNGLGFLADVAATALSITTQPAGSVSGVALTTQPVISAVDAFGNVDVQFTETITLTEASAGTLTNNTKAAVAGVATFSGLTYTATADQQDFTLTANDEDGVNDNFGTLDANQIASDVVATKLSYENNLLSPFVVNSGYDVVNSIYTSHNTAFTTVPDVVARDANGVLDTDYVNSVTLSNSFSGTNTGSVTSVSLSGDTDSDSGTVTVTAVAGVAKFTGLSIAYTAGSFIGSSEIIKIKASDDNPATADELTANIPVNILPNMQDANAGLSLTLDEDIKTDIDTSDFTIADKDVTDELTLTLTVDKGVLFSINENGITDNVTISGVNNTAGSSAISIEGLPADINTFLDGARFSYQTALNDTSNAKLTLTAKDAYVTGTIVVDKLINVTAINDAPVISGTPLTTIAQDVAYSFTPTVTDVDAGDTTTFTVTGNPSWLTINASTGELSGTPTSSDVATTNGIVITVADTDGLQASLAAFSITVSDVNEAPVISGMPSTTIAQDVAYSFTPTVTDADAGDTTTFTVTGNPSWLTINASTGVLSGTSTSSDVATTTGIVITVADTDGLTASLAAFSITVTNVNDAPVISGAPLTTIAQEAAYSFTPTVTDADAGDTTTFTVTGNPSWLTINASTGELSGTPTSSDVATTSDIVITVADKAGLTASLAAFSIEVLPDNSAPIAVDDSYEFDLNSQNQYILNVLENDVDADGDVITLIDSDSSIGQLTIVDNQLVLAVDDNFVGVVNLSYNITDGKELYSEANVVVRIVGTTDSALTVIAPEAVELNATGLYTKANLGTATATNSAGQAVPVSLISESVFSPGNNIAYWQATEESTELTKTVSQIVKVHPLVSLSKNQIATEGSDVSVRVLLNGDAPVYPLLVPFTLSGSADADDYAVSVEQVEIASGTEAVFTVRILLDSIVEADETIIVTLNDVNLGSKSTHTITIVERNIAPTVDLAVNQDDELRQIIAADGGLVTVSANVDDVNNDGVTTQWIYDSSLNVTDESDTSLTFEPAGLSDGVYSLSLIATEDGVDALTSSDTVYFSVSSTLATLTTIDSDGDLIPDNQEGYNDNDDDGIPDYLDAIAECNVMPQQAATQDSFLVEGDAGICIRKGNTLAAGKTGGLQLTSDELNSATNDVDDVANVGGIFDYIASGLPVAGQSYRIVFPQIVPIPSNAVYRKYNNVSGWNTFAEDADNQIHSSAGQEGFCPPPASELWVEGLNAGDWCVQLTIVDGGLNDDDGIANGTIVDPGGVAVLNSSNTTPVAVADSARVQSDSSIVINVLDNDTDADEDTLSIGVATAVLGTVTVISDNQLEYVPAADFVGVDTVTYSVFDGQGGTTSATVTVTVFVNNAPITTVYTAETDDRTSIDLAVLTHVSDSDGDALTLLSATVDNGSVTVNSDNTLTYTPTFGFDGVATISYEVTDNVNDTVFGQVNVQVTALEVVTVTNESTGGSMGIMLLLMAGLIVLRISFKKRAVSLVAMIISLSSFNASAEWFMSGAIGQSNVAKHIKAPSISGVDSATFDDKDMSYYIGFGYQYTDFSLAVSYEALGDTSASIVGSVSDVDSFQQAVSDVAPKLVEGINFEAQYTLWHNEYVGVNAGIGLFAWDLDYESKWEDSTIHIDDSGVDLFYRMALNYNVTPDIEVNFQATHYQLLVNDINNLSLGFVYKFN